MAVAIASDDAAYFSPGLRRSHSQPKFGPAQPGFRQSSSASRISDVYHHPQTSTSRSFSDRNLSPGSASSVPTISLPSPISTPPSAVASASGSPSTSNPTSRGVPARVASSPTKHLVPSIRVPHRLGRPGYGSSPSGTDDGTDDGTDGDAHMDYAHYDDFYSLPVDYEASPSPRGLGDSCTASPNDNNTLSTGPSRSNSSEFDFFDHIAEDDTAVRAQPSRHVDYLSHNWREEDIWESWKYIVSRRGDYSNSARLENASWRTWMKSKNKLRTISPEELNWLKECDVTWLYGPLQTGSALQQEHPTDSVDLTKSNSFLINSHKKPILKKRSMSEIMLQRSLSASSLVKQAAAAVQAQQKEIGVRRVPRPRLERAATDYMAFPFSSLHVSPGLSSLLPSAFSSGIVSPSAERKHIHFNEQVEQCIAVDIKGDDDDDDNVAIAPYSYDSDSDDGAIMMKRTMSKHRLPQPRRRSSQHAPSESKTIAMLPSTTLKYREDAPDELADVGTAMKHSYRSPVMSPSASQETLRPSKSSGKMHFSMHDDDDEAMVEEDEGQLVVQQIESAAGHSDNSDDDDDDNSDDDDGGFGMAMGSVARRRAGGLLAPSASTSRLGSMVGSSFTASGGGLKRTTSTSSLAAEPAGMRRTASGMFMPNDEGEPAIGGIGGLVGRVIDTVNTARDIAYVIWNVGWRK